MKILFISAFTPSEIGAAVKNTKITLEKLSQNHVVDLVYYRYKHDPDYIVPNENVRIKYIWYNTLWLKLLNIILFPFLYPQFSVRFNWFFAYKIKKLINRNQYDIVIFDHSQMFMYAKLLNKSINKIMMSHDVIAQRVQRTYSKVIYKWCLLSEKYCLQNKNTRIYTFCSKDCNLLKKLYGFDSYVNGPYLEPNVINVYPKSITDDFVMFGMWRRSDNLDGALWFFNKVAPLLSKKIKIRIIGKGFPQNELVDLDSHIDVDYLGFVDNPYTIISNSKAVLAPIFTGAGLKFKVAESLACGTPVIGTEVALEGLPEKCSYGMLLANNEFDFVKFVESIDFTLENRIALKKQFLECFDNERIPDYINNYSQNINNII